MIGRAGAHSSRNTFHSDYMNDYSLPLGGYESWQHTLLTGGDTYSVKVVDLQRGNDYRCIKRVETPVRVGISWILPRRSMVFTPRRQLS